MYRIAEKRDDWETTVKRGIVAVIDTHEEEEKMADHETHKSMIGSHPNEAGQMTKMREVENQSSTLVPIQEIRAFCPSENKRFYCGIAKKLGCQVCAKK